MAAGIYRENVAEPATAYARLTSDFWFTSTGEQLRRPDKHAVLVLAHLAPWYRRAIARRQSARPRTRTPPRLPACGGDSRRRSPPRSYLRGRQRAADRARRGRVRGACASAAETHHARLSRRRGRCGMLGHVGPQPNTVRRSIRRAGGRVDATANDARVPWAAWTGPCVRDIKSTTNTLAHGRIDIGAARGLCGRIAGAAAAAVDCGRRACGFQPLLRAQMGTTVRRATGKTTTMAAAPVPPAAATQC